MQLTKKKILLEHLVVGRLTKANNVNQEELDDIIRYGSKELFEDENDESRQIHYDEAAIERLLDRDQVDGDESVEDEEEDGFLKGFKVANFEYIDEAKAQAEKEEARRKAAAEAENSERNYWDELLKDRYDVQKVEEHTAMGKGKRSRKQMAAADEDDIHDLSSEDEDYSLEDDISDNDTSLQGNISGKRGQYSKRKSRNVDSIPLMEGEGRTLRVLGFNHAQRAMFLQTLNRFGFQNYDWKEYLPRLKGKSVEEIQRYAELVMAHLVEEINDSDYFSDGVPKEMMRVDDVLVRIANISLIEEKMAATGPGKITNIFPNYLLYEFQGLSGGRIWKAEHDLLLLRGILKHGYARWQYISDDRENGLFEAARRELHLPSVNEIIGAQLNEANGNLEGAQEGQANTTSMSHYKEIQRKIVEFLRKRYHLMERALNMEYAVIKKKIPVPDDITEQGVPAGHAPFIPDISELLRELPNLEPISTNELVSEGTAGQLQVPHLYNKMCGVLEESGAYALSSFFGDKSASSSLANSLRQFETVCENVVEALRPHQNGTGSAIKEELVDAATKAAAAAAPQQDSGHDAPHGQSSTAKADMEIDG